ncbi:MAG: hypothetical protein ACLFSB_10105 [Chitinispirillaceae bacterium]
MGHANLAYGRDGGPTSNPANLPLDSVTDIALSYGGFWGNAFSTSVISYATSLSENDGFGVSLGYLHVPNIKDTRGLTILEDNTIVYDESDISYETTSELYLTFGYGKSFKLNSKYILSTGLALHAQRRRLLEDENNGTQVGYGIGADIGATLHFLRNGFRLTVLADDITSNYIYWHDDYHDQSGPHLRLGAGWRKSIPYIHGRFTVAYQTPDLLQNEGIRVLHDEALDRIEVTEDGKYLNDISALFTGGRFGLEYVVRNIFAIRVGVNAGNVSFGGGLRLFDQMLGIDFGYTSSELPGTYILSLAYRLK